MDVPEYWRGSADDVRDVVGLVKRGKVHRLCETPGGRTVYMVQYGEKNDLKRTANYSSAMGAGDFTCYADKTGEDYVPTVLLVGAMHGGEFEGTVAINNLIANIETGRDFAGNENPELLRALEGINLLLIPCINLDGRARIPLKTFVGQDYESFRFYSQGTWKDGSLCEHPLCKRIHPIKDSSDFLGGYFNDNGVNLVHDNFFFPMAEETKALMRVADEYVPDMTMHLHGGGNCKQQFFLFDYLPGRVKKKISALSAKIAEACDRAGVGEHYYERSVEGTENDENPPSFNIVSAHTALCGEPCVVYESNQGLSLPPDKDGLTNSYSFEEIYLHHKILFENVFKFVKECKTV